MLNLMRRKKESLKWVLWVLIIALTAGMVLLFVSTPIGSGASEMGNYIAKINGQEITVDEYRSNLLAILNRLGPNVRRDTKTIHQYGTLVLHQMVRTKLLAQEAERLGFKVSDEEIADEILKNPYFTTANGDFIGTKEYRSRLRQLGTTDEIYEKDLRQALLVQKLQDFISHSVTVSNKEVRNKFNYLNNQAKIKYVSISEYKYFVKIKPTEDELKKYYEENKDKYKIGETRQVQYMLLDIVKLRNALVKKIPESEIKTEYESGRGTKYKDQVRASHILIKVPKNAKKEEIARLRKKAEHILELAKKPGADFAALAKKYSEDPGSARNGGDLSFFPRGRMVKEFENAAFSMKVGEISGLVRTQFGFHIIKTTGRRDYNYYKNLIARSLAEKKASAQLEEAANQAMAQAKKTGDLIKVAKEFGAVVGTSRPFNQKHPDYSLGNAPHFVEDVFNMKIHEIGNVYRTFRGFVIPKLIKIIPPHVQSFNEVRNQIVTDFKSVKAKDMAKKEAQKFLKVVKKLGNMEKAAKLFNLKVETSEKFKIDDTISKSIGKSPILAKAVLKYEEGDIGGPVAVGGREIIFKVIERYHPTDEAFKIEKEDLRKKMLEEKSRSLLNEILGNIYMKYQRSKKILVNQKLLNEILG